MQKILPLPELRMMPLEELDERRAVALVTSDPAWQAVKSKLRLRIAWRVDVTEATAQAWEAQMTDLRGEAIYAVGGGLSVDAAKYMAASKGMELVCIPTALSVDAFLTGASGVRRQGCVRYLETKPPDVLIVDFEVIASAPPSIRAAGICDVLSIATGRWDWKFAEERDKNPPGMEFIPYIDQAAAAILNGALDCAEAAGQGDPAGLKQLLDCLAIEVQLTNQIGHARPEEGSEHYFAYAVENLVGHGWLHAELVCPGILLMARAQGQDTRALRRAMEACSIQLSSIPERVIEQTLTELPDYCRAHELPFGIAHVLQPQQIKGLMLG